MANIFESAALLKGNLTAPQEKALRSLAIKLGKKRFATYRAALKITAPIPRLSKSEAYRLIACIARDLEGEQ